MSIVGEMSEWTMREFMTITKALADESRVRMLLALRGRELCLCQVTELLGLATSTVSKHLSILRQAGLIETRKDGRWVYCRLGDEAAPAVRAAIDWACATLCRDPKIVQDAKRLRQILKMDPEEICRRQAGK